MIFFRINSKTLTRNPTEISHTKVNVETSDRTINGTMVVDLIAVKNKVSFVWDYLNQQDMLKLLGELTGNTFQEIEFIDNGGELVQITAHSGDVSYAPYYSGGTSGLKWVNVKLTFEEK